MALQTFLLNFNAPWCGHCKNLAPVYELVATAYKNSKDVVIAKVDADAEKSLGSRFGVIDFPTIKWFPKGSTSPETYDGSLEEDAFNAFIKGKTVAVKVLTSSSFEKEVLNSGVSTLVMIYAPWDGHGKRLAPVYEQVAQAFQLEKSCIVANLDGTAAEDVVEKFHVIGYPTLRFFYPDGESVEFHDDRTLETIVSYLNRQCGTFRNTDGSLNEEAGKVKVLDDIVQNFFAPTEDNCKVELD